MSFPQDIDETCEAPFPGVGNLVGGAGNREKPPFYKATGKLETRQL